MVKDLQGMCEDLQGMCELGHKLAFWKTSDVYEGNLFYDKIIVTPAVLWHGFPLLVTKEMDQIPRFYGICPIPQLVILVYERTKLLERTFSVKFVYEEIASMIELSKDQGQSFPVIKTFSHEEHNLGFTGEPSSYSGWYEDTYLVKGNWMKESFQVMNNYCVSNAFIALSQLSLIIY